MPHPGFILASAVVVALGVVLGAAYYAFCEEDNQRHRQLHRSHQGSKNGSSHRTYATPDCPICLDGIANRISRTLTCGHRYHEDCIDRWFRTNGSRTCPLCVRHVG